MKITGSFRAEDGDQRWHVEIADDRFVTVRRSEDNGNYYIVRNTDGSTVRDSAGKTYRNHSYDDHEVVQTVIEVAEKWPAAGKEGVTEKYIEGNKAAWEEAFDNRDASWGADIPERIRKEAYPFFEKEMAAVLRNIDTEGKTIGQFCCNNGRELLSLVKSGKASKGVGFDIAENQVAFANEKAKELNLPCSFEAVNIYDIDERFKEQFDVVIITIGALCWFKDLDRFFAIVAKCMKPGAVIVLNEQHPCTNMLATEGDAEFDPAHRMECHYSYFTHEWTGNEGMYYMTQKNYHSKTFTDFTHSMSEILSGICNNGIVVTGLQEFDHDISGGFSSIDHSGFPLSMLLQGKKL